MAQNDEDILEIRAEDIIEDDAEPAEALIETPPVVSPAKIEAVSPGDGLFNRDASYQEQFADRIERLKRPRKSGQPLGKEGWVFLVLAVVVLVPVILVPLLLLRAILSNQEQEKSKDERFALKREQRPLGKQGDRGVRPPEQGNKKLAAHQGQLTFLRGVEALDKQDYDEAIRLLSRYLEGNKVPAAYTARGLAFYHKKQYDRAVTDY